MVGMLSFYSILVTLVVFCGSQKLNPNETAPNFVLSTLDGPLIYKGLNKPGSNVKGPMIFHSYSSKSGFLEALWNKDSSLLDLIDNSPDNTHYVFLNSEEDAHKTALWMKQRFQSILEKYFTIAKSLERCDVTKPVNADRRSFGGSSKPLPSQRKKHHFPKPHRRIERRSLPDYGNNPEQAVIKTFKQRPRIVRKKSNMAKHHHDKAWNMKAYKKRNNIVYFHNNNGVFTLAGHFKRQTEQQSNHRDKNTASNIKHQTIMTGDSKRQSMKHQNHKNGTYHTISQEENLTKNFKRQTTMKHKENQSISKRKDNLTDLKKHSNNKQDSHQTNSTKRQTITHQENLIKRSFIIHDDDEVLKRSLVSTMYDYLAEDENEVAATDNCHDDALQKRVAEIINGGPEKLKQAWMKRLHFVNESVLDVGNFIPLVLSRWYCSGHGCGLDQVAVEGKEEGSVKLVSKRLDGRYDWLTSPYSIKQKRAKIVDIGDGCDNSTSTKYTNTVVLISNNNTCTYFQKLKNAQEKGALCAVIYANNGETLFDMTCQNAECEVEMKIPGTMIPYEDGIKIKDLIKNNKEINVHFQHTPWWNFFFGIDEQGKLQEVGWLVYPSMIFLSYQAKWLNYVTNLLHDISSMKQKSDNEELTIFQGKIMQGNHGVVACHEIKDSVFKDLSKFGHVYLDMALGCPGSTDFTCPHWDHTVQLYLNCGESRVQCKENKKKKRNHHQVRLGPEIGRWITPFRRRIGRWLTDIRPLAPLFTSKSCTFTMKTVPWAMPWKPSLKLWLTDKKSGNIDQPTMFEELFRGGTFNGSYNLDSPKGRREKKINVPKNVTKAMLFATITGHGSDDNNCAEFCVTSHHFQINENDNERVFDNAGTATGCADRVSEGSEPNEHGTWLYGRNGWCDGENVGPWIEDVTKQIRPGEENTIKYNGFFNSKDPAPKRDPGNIIMYSYLIFYTKSGGGEANDDMKNNR